MGQHAKNIPLGSIKDTVDEMRLIFNSSYTRILNNRRAALESMLRMMTENEDAIKAALRHDMGRDEFWSIAGDIDATVVEIQRMLDNLEEYNAPKGVGTSLKTFPAIDYVSYMLYVVYGMVMGCTLSDFDESIFMKNDLKQCIESID